MLLPALPGRSGPASTLAGHLGPVQECQQLMEAEGLLPGGPLVLPLTERRLIVVSTSIRRLPVPEPRVIQQFGQPVINKV
jgi:hypothetical protein